MEFLRRIWTQLRGIWAGMSTTRRVVVASVAGLAVVLIGALVYYQSRVDYRPLFTGLAPEDAGRLTARLQTRNIPYRLEADGSTISVPADRLAAARVELAAEGLPLTGGKGFEVFDESPLGMTPFVQSVNYNRALQAELARSITSMDPVAQARVHIVRPDPSPFVREQKPTTASVVLKLKPGARLNRSSADAIVALVSRAVEGLAPENVTLVDTRGRLLSDPRPSDDRATGGQLETRREMEAYLASKAEDLLRRHLGMSRAIVRVAADVNLQRVKERSELFNPEQRAVVAERITTQKTTGPTSGARGIAGTTSNVGRTAGLGTTGAAGPGGTSSSEMTQTDYVVSKTSRELENRLNSVERLTVAALVDLTAINGGDKGPRLTLNDARDLIKQAIGFKEGRDEIKVTDVRLASETEVPEDGAEADRQRRTQEILALVRTGALIAGLLLIIVLGILVAWRLRPRRAPTPAPEPVTPPQPPAPAVPPAEVDAFRRLAEDDPDRVARMLTMLLEPTS